MKFSKILNLFCGALFFFLFGVAVGKYQIFPYQQLAYTKKIAVDEKKPAKGKPGRVLGRISHFEEFSSDFEFVMVGDSITQGGIWSEIFPGVSIGNRGVHGNTTFDVLNRMDSIVSTRAEKAFVMLGINDILSGFGVSEVFENYMRIIVQLKRAGMEVIVQSTLECSLPKCFEQKGNIYELNRLLEEASQRENFKFLDLNVIMSDQNGGLKPEYTYDGVHLSGKGYAEWAKALEGQIE